MPTVAAHENHYVPTRGQKLMATIEEAFGKVFNNQARILESRTTRTGVPYGPGGTVTPPASFFKTQPPSIGASDGIPIKSKDGEDLRLVASAASDNTVVSSGAVVGGGKAVHGPVTGLATGHHAGAQEARAGTRTQIAGQ